MNNTLAVKIAQDVLAQLRTKRYNACSVYVTLRHFDYDEIDMDESFQTIFQEDQDVTCEVCALGSVFVSLVNIKNEFSVWQVDQVDFSEITEALSGIFHQRDLYLMEYVFERAGAGALTSETLRALPNEPVTVENTVNGDEIIFSRSELERALQYGEKYYDNSERLKVIMRNIVRNEGRFIIPQRIRNKEKQNMGS
jgi:hypothetical protein